MCADQVAALAWVMTIVFVGVVVVNAVFDSRR